MKEQDRHAIFSRHPASAGGGFSRRETLMAAVAATAGVRAQASSAATPIVHRRRPDIILIVSDQQRGFPDLPGGLTLPSMDRLRQRGTDFLEHYSPTAPCAPARAVLYTGTHTQINRMVSNPGSGETDDLSPDLPTLGTMLRSAGYRTAYKGKWHLSTIAAGRRGPGFQTARDALEPYGFSDYSYAGDPTGYAWTGFREDRAIAADAIRALDSLAMDDQPFFLAVNFVNPHDIMFMDATGRQSATRLVRNLISPLLPAPEVAPYDRRWNLPLPASFSAGLDEKPASHSAEQTYLDMIYGEMPRDDGAAWQRFQDYYFNCLTDLDTQVGLLLDAIARHPRLSGSIILFTSDHGERGGAHGLRQKGGDIYKENLRVPMIVVHPDVGSTQTAALSSAIDVAPTLLSMAGLSPADQQSRWPLLRGADLSPSLGNARHRGPRDREGILLNYAVRARWSLEATRDRLMAVAARKLPAPGTPRPSGERVLIRGVHAGQWKFARYFAPENHHRPETLEALRAGNDLELYDLASDPHEMRNLANDPAQAARLVQLNAQTNRLIDREVGDDGGAEFRPVATSGAS